MPRRTHAPALALAAALAATGAAAAEPPFGVKSGLLRLSSESPRPTTTVLYFDDYGLKQAAYTTASVATPNGTVQKRRATIYANGQLTKIDLDAGVGTTEASDVPATPVPDAELLDAQLTPAQRRELRFERLPDLDVAGHTCRGFQFLQDGSLIRVYAWRGIPLRFEVREGDRWNVAVNVVEVAVDLALPPQKFAIPKDVEIRKR